MEEQLTLIFSLNLVIKEINGTKKSAYLGAYQFSSAIFRITASKGSSFTGDIAIDDFEVKEGPNCYDPNNLNVNNISSTF